VSHGLMRFMRAHGQTPGPGQRPRTVGALSGLVAGIAALLMLKWSGAVASLANALNLRMWVIPILYVAIATLAGALYGAVFKRAASDPRGGWLFGISYGFLLWMLGPVTLLQTILARPLTTGVAAMGILGANLLSGLLLGLLFRPLHTFVRHGFRARAVGERGTEMASQRRQPRFAFPHVMRKPK
jgi:hypothetical protein